jgi:N-acyl-D-aspartate/D-glutamate deacylase
MPSMVIRGGTVVDGTGAPPRTADVAIDDGRVVAVGRVDSRGRQEIDADGLLVTPGFVDLHTHYDGQATWDPMLAPSSVQGVTTLAMGNCGVGFAPAKPDRHDWLIAMLEGVEDIPGTALAEGLSWNWESFPEYLAALDGLRRTVDIAAHVPHAPLRAYVMGERGADPREHPTDDEIATMGRLVAEALDAGAIGFATSRTEAHRTSEGKRLGTLRAESAELLGIAAAIGQQGTGVIQLISDTVQTTDHEFAEGELELIEAVARTARRPLSFTIQQTVQTPDRWREIIAHIEGWRAAGLDILGQVAPRTIGILIGLEASLNPFYPCPSYREVAALAVPERVRALRDEERRARILAEHAALLADPSPTLMRQVVGGFDIMFELDDPVDYLLRGASVADRARQSGTEPASYVYDVLLRGEGTQLLYVPAFNFAYGSLDDVREMIASPATLYGLSDAGAHCGAICDASTTTSYLTVWARDCAPELRMPVETVVRNITSRTAGHVGWRDRGVLTEGSLADVNVIDFDRLELHPPRIAKDLPAAGRRLVQEATGYRWTIKRGVPIVVDDEHTGELPGRLLRGGRTEDSR